MIERISRGNKSFRIHSGNSKMKDSKSSRFAINLGDSLLRTSKILEAYGVYPRFWGVSFRKWGIGIITLSKKEL